MVPAREGLRLPLQHPILFQITVGEVVPAREGLRLIILNFINFFNISRRSGSSKRRIKTLFNF